MDTGRGIRSPPLPSHSHLVIVPGSSSGISVRLPCFLGTSGGPGGQAVPRGPICLHWFDESCPPGHANCNWGKCQASRERIRTSVPVLACDGSSLRASQGCSEYARGVSHPICRRHCLISLFTKTVVAVFCGKARSKYGRPFDVADAMTALLAERSCFSFALRQTRLRCYIYGFACAILASCSVSACNGNELFFYYASTASLLRLCGGVRRCVFELVPDLLVLWGFRSWVNTAQASVAVGFLCSAFW